MLKKAGILVAATAAGLLAVSPLAFAGGNHDRHHDRDRSVVVVDQDDRQVNRVDESRENNQVGLVNTGDINTLNNVNVCPSAPVAAGIGGLGNVLGILGSGVAAGDADADSDVTCVNDDSNNFANIDD